MAVSLFTVRATADRALTVTGAPTHGAVPNGSHTISFPGSVSCMDPELVQNVFLRIPDQQSAPVAVENGATAHTTRSYGAVSPIRTKCY